eukprot:jgi/Chlat1/2937/Chrsp2S08908
MASAGLRIGSSVSASSLASVQRCDLGAAAGPSRPQAAGAAAPCWRAPVVMAKALQGRVVGTKASKTAVVEVTRIYEHPRYRKKIRTSHKYAVHDETEEATVGDFVQIIPIAPKSKTKTFGLASIIRKGRMLPGSDILVVE